jgi:hypothetical protein
MTGEHMDDRDLRKVILVLVKGCKLYQVRALTVNAALKVVLSLPPNKRAALTAPQLEAYMQEIPPKVQEMADKGAAQVEKALEGSTDFLALLQLYASKCHWE